MFDTIYVFIGLMVVHYSFLDDLKVFAGDNYEKYKNIILSSLEEFALIYGDDTTWSMSKIAIDLIESIPVVGKGKYLDEVVKRFKTLFDMELKPKGSSDTEQFSTPYTKCTHDGILLQENGKYGLKFLRRHFILGEFSYKTPKGEARVSSVPCSLRKVSDAWARATNTHHDATTYSQWFPKLKSFMYENMGVSLATDRFTRFMLGAIRTNLDYLEGVEDEDYVVLSNRFGYSRVKDIQGRAVKFDRGDAEIIEKYKRVAPWITEDEIFSLLIPSRDWLLSNLAFRLDATYHINQLFSCSSLKEGVFRCDEDDLEW
jgi:hypothetical protein